MSKKKQNIIILGGFLICVLIAAYFIFLYQDLTNTVDNANILLDATRKGKILQFYELSVECSQTNFASNYNFIIYVIFALWQAPAYFIVHILGNNYLECPWAMLWSKTLIVVLSVVVAYYIYKIVFFNLHLNLSTLSCINPPYSLLNYSIDFSQSLKFYINLSNKKYML